MRRLQFDRTIPTAFWQFGADAGVEVYVARVGYLSFAIGYLRPVNGFAKRQQFTSVFVDTWSLQDRHRDLAFARPERSASLLAVD